MTEPTHPRPRDPAELGFEAIVYEKSAAARHDHAEPTGCIERIRFPDAGRSPAPARTPPGTTACAPSWSRAPAARSASALIFALGRGTSRQPSEYWKWFGAFKDMHDRSARSESRRLRGSTGSLSAGGNELQMACDLSVIVDTAFIQHVGLKHGSVPAGGATQWLQLMVGDRRARRSLPATRDPGRAGGRVGARQSWYPKASSTPSWTSGWTSSPRGCPQTTRYAKQQLNVARSRLASDGRSRTRLARHVHARRGGPGAVRAFLDRSKGQCGEHLVGRAVADEVLTHRDGAVLTITLNRPDVYNAINRAMHDGLADALREADPEVRGRDHGGGARILLGQTCASSRSFLRARRSRRSAHSEHPCDPALEKPVMRRSTARVPVPGSSRVRVRRSHRRIRRRSSPASSGSGSSPTPAARGSSTGSSASRALSSGWCRIGDSAPKRRSAGPRLDVRPADRPRRVARRAGTRRCRRVAWR